MMQTRTLCIKATMVAKRAILALGEDEAVQLLLAISAARGRGWAAEAQTLVALGLMRAANILHSLGWNSQHSAGSLKTHILQGVGCCPRCTCGSLSATNRFRLSQSRSFLQEKPQNSRCMHASAIVTNVRHGALQYERGERDPGETERACPCRDFRCLCPVKQPRPFQLAPGT
eukprot:2920202-Rhodomonas_salina.2